MKRRLAANGRFMIAPPTRKGRKAELPKNP